MTITNRILNTIIVRQALNDFDALQIANAMQGIGHVDVISIVCYPVKPLVHGGSTLCWSVFAKYSNHMWTPEQIDDQIARALRRNG